MCVGGAAMHMAAQLHAPVPLLLLLLLPALVVLACRICLLALPCRAHTAQPA